MTRFERGIDIAALLVAVFGCGCGEPATSTTSSRVTVPGFTITVPYWSHDLEITVDDLDADMPEGALAGTLTFNGGDDVYLFTAQIDPDNPSSMSERVFVTGALDDEGEPHTEVGYRRDDTGFMTYVTAIRSADGGETIKPFSTADDLLLQPDAAILFPFLAPAMRGVAQLRLGMMASGSDRGPPTSTARIGPPPKIAGAIAEKVIEHRGDIANHLFKERGTACKGGCWQALKGSVKHSTEKGTAEHPGRCPQKQGFEGQPDECALFKAKPYYGGFPNAITEEHITGESCTYICAMKFVPGECHEVWEQTSHFDCGTASSARCDANDVKVSMQPFFNRRICTYSDWFGNGNYGYRLFP